MHKYEKVKTLGEGGFGKALLVRKKTTRELLVVKEVRLGRMSQKDRKETFQEAAVLKSLHHINIVECKESFTENNIFYIVMEYCNGGDLEQKINGFSKKKQKISEDEVLHDFIQLALAIKYIHDRKILHRDLKAQNVFLNKNGTVKLGDFGIARVLDSTAQLCQTQIGTPYYLSPEICAGKRYNSKTDIWSLGCILYELCTLKHAFDAKSMAALMNAIKSGNYAPVSTFYSKNIRDLIGKMLTKDPTKRPSINQIIRMSFIQDQLSHYLDETMVQYELNHTILHGRRPLADATIILPKSEEKAETPQKPKQDNKPSPNRQTPMPVKAPEAGRKRTPIEPKRPVQSPDPKRNINSPQNRPAKPSPIMSKEDELKAKRAQEIAQFKKMAEEIDKKAQKANQQPQPPQQRVQTPRKDPEAEAKAKRQQEIDQLKRFALERDKLKKQAEEEAKKKQIEEEERIKRQNELQKKMQERERKRIEDEIRKKQREEERARKDEEDRAKREEERVKREEERAKREEELEQIRKQNEIKRQKEAEERKKKMEEDRRKRFILEEEKRKRAEEKEEERKKKEAEDEIIRRRRLDEIKAKREEENQRIKMELEEKRLKRLQDIQKNRELDEEARRLEEEEINRREDKEEERREAERRRELVVHMLNEDNQRRKIKLMQPTFVEDPTDKIEDSFLQQMKEDQPKWAIASRVITIIPENTRMREIPEESTLVNTRNDDTEELNLPPSPPRKAVVKLHEENSKQARDNQLKIRGIDPYRTPPKLSTNNDEILQKNVDQLTNEERKILYKRQKEAAKLNEHRNGTNDNFFGPTPIVQANQRPRPESANDIADDNVDIDNNNEEENIDNNDDHDLEMSIYAYRDGLAASLQEDEEPEEGFTDDPDDQYEDADDSFSQDIQEADKIRTVMEEELGYDKYVKLIDLLRDNEELPEGTIIEELSSRMTALGRRLIELENKLLDNH